MQAITRMIINLIFKVNICSWWSNNQLEDHHLKHYIFQLNPHLMNKVEISQIKINSYLAIDIETIQTKYCLVAAWPIGREADG